MKVLGGWRAWLAGLVLAATGCGYNTIQTMDEQVNQAKGQIAAQLQRRADLVPNLVETVKGVTKQEDTVFISIAEARAKLAGAVQRGDPREMAAGQRRPDRAPRPAAGHLGELSRSCARARTSGRCRTSSTGTENRISVARQDYNTAVGEYNAYIRRFPYNLTAKVFGMGKPREYFEAKAGAEEAPKVQF